MAVNAKYSISVPGLIRIPPEQQPRQAALINNLNEATAERKTVSILFLSLGAAGRKNLSYKVPYMGVAMAALREIKEICESCFLKPRKRTLDRYKFFSRKQHQTETLRQFWNVLTGLASRCDFGEQTNSFIKDAFIQNRTNKIILQRLCTEPKGEPEEALRFAAAFEE